MHWLAFTFAATCSASLVLTPLVRWFARKWEIVDRPDGVRKLHERPVPLWGGAAVYLAFALGLALACHGSFASGPTLDTLAKILAIAAGLVCLFGGVDDYRHLSPRLKLLLQTAAILPVVLVGCWVDRIVVFGHPIELGWFGIPLTVLWLLGCINALNLLDGMDGLASLVGLSTAAMMGIIAASEGRPEVAVIATVLAGALAGFLVYNLPPATIFLGDSGSMVIGLVVGLLGIQGGLKTSATLSITAPAVVMALPIFDVALAVVRRRLTGRRIDMPDRQHIHHRLLDRGLNPWQVLCILGAVCLLTGAAATMATILRSDTLAWVALLTLLVLAVRMRLFGHYEFSLVKRATSRGLARLAARLLPIGRHLPRRAKLEPLAFEELWDRLVDEMRPWNVRQLELTISRHGDLASLHRWSDPSATDETATGWSVGVSFHKPGGQLCELRAGVDHRQAPQPRYLSALVSLLKDFAQRAAQCPAGSVRLAVIGDRPEYSSADDYQYRRAA